MVVSQSNLKDRISISNLAWKTSQSEEIYFFLNKIGIKNIELAPKKIPGFTGFKDILFARKYKKYLLENFDIKVCSIQAFLYESNIQIFDKENKDLVINYFIDVFKFSFEIGCKLVVLGSPKNRRITHPYDFKEVRTIMNQLASLANIYSIKLLLEPNPSEYGSNFLLNNYEVYDFIYSSQINNLYINFDLGANKISDDECFKNIKNFYSFVKHVHLSAPYLNELTVSNELIELIALFENEGYKGYYSIEMLEVDIDRIISIMENILEMLRGTNGN